MPEPAMQASLSICIGQAASYSKDARDTVEASLASLPDVQLVDCHQPYTESLTEQILAFT